MKSFVISIILLAVVLAGVIVNIVLMCKACDNILRLISELPINEEDFGKDDTALKELKKQWHKTKTAVRYVMDYRELDRADSAFTAIESCWYSNDYQQYRVYLDEFSHAVQRMREISEITPENIL